MISGIMKGTERFSEVFLRSIDIHELLPQQEPFVMIGCLTHFDMIRTVTETKIQENNIDEVRRLLEEGIDPNVPTFPESKFNAFMQICIF